MKLILSSVICSILLVPTFGHGDEWVFGTLGDVRLPKPLSDHTAFRAPSGLVYIAGGCDSANGNVWKSDSKDFVCDSISNSFFSFDPTAGSFQTLPNMPQARYRHSSAIVGNKVFVIGGRNLADDILPAIDVYDIAAGTWSSIGTIPDIYLVSDHASFALNNELYIVGGYSVGYVAMPTVVKMSVNGTDVSFTEAAPLNEGRGDIIGVASDDGTSAYVAGGFTHTDWCAPLASAEEYNLAGNTWTTLPNLIDARGEVVLVESENHLYALGGEGPLDYDVCASGEVTSGTKTVGIDSVEQLAHGDTVWKILESFPEERFRFAAIASGGLVYSFGGQAPFDPDCQCFKTADDVFIFGEEEDVAAKGEIIFTAAGNRLSVLTGLVAGVVSFALFN